MGSIDSPVGGELLVVDPRTNTAFITSDSKIVVLDLAKGVYAGTIDLGHRGYWIAIDPAAGNVYVPASGTSGSAGLTVIDTATRTVKGVINIGDSAEGITADPLSHKVYVRPLASEIIVVEPCATMKCN
ncbi:YncE family protein [Nocardia sp. SYP-A9097]|uniref:YncE family protein n=1 Tax=Nocardia sp. SYP-A9097 TaxID=2663237 RepID=UPI00129B9D51|nr:hypothetical protein [Nocardia sp. SYP-A9097]